VIFSKFIDRSRYSNYSEFLLVKNVSMPESSILVFLKSRYYNLHFWEKLRFFKVSEVTK